MQKLSVPSRLWYENQERELTFPDRWKINNLNSPGFEKPGLTSHQIKEKIDHREIGYKISMKLIVYGMLAFLKFHFNPMN